MRGAQRKCFHYHQHREKRGGLSIRVFPVYRRDLERLIHVLASILQPWSNRAGFASWIMVFRVATKSFRTEAIVMKNLLALVGAVVVLVGGLGWYLGWYKFGTATDGKGHVKTDLDWNVDKVKTDLKKGEQTIESFIDHNGKKVEGTPTSRPLETPPGGWTLPVLPQLPTPPAAAPIERNADGSLKISVDIPPPPVFPKQ
jgi:hypothetical protein